MFTCFRGVVLAGFASAMLLAWPAHAALFTYEYHGNPFRIAFAPYTTSNFVSGQFTIDLPSNANLAYQNRIADVTDFSFSDGVHTLQDEDSLVFKSISFATGGSGEITAWAINIEETSIVSTIFTSMVEDAGTIPTGINAFAEGLLMDNPGSWRQVPEPGALALLGTGFAGLGLFRRRDLRREGTTARRIHEHGAAEASHLIAMGRNPLRLTQIDVADDRPKAERTRSAMRWLLRQIRTAFRSAASPTSAMPANGSIEPVESARTVRPGGSLLRRMD